MHCYSVDLNETDCLFGQIGVQLRRGQLGQAAAFELGCNVPQHDIDALDVAPHLLGDDAGLCFEFAPRVLDRGLVAADDVNRRHRDDDHDQQTATPSHGTASQLPRGGRDQPVRDIHSRGCSRFRMAEIRAS